MTTGKGIGGHHAPWFGRSDTWLTPPYVLKALGKFDLDPCAAPSPRPWATAKRHIELPTDGLAAEWRHGENIWLNPPYGKQTGLWIKKLAEHGNGMALTFARTETKFWHESIFPHAHAVLFIAGRLHFHYPDGKQSKDNSGGPSSLVAFGRFNSAVLRECGLPGKYIQLR